MNVRWIILIYILKIHLKAITPQHHHHHHHYYDDPPQQYDEEDEHENIDEELSSEFSRRRDGKYRNRAQDYEECYCTCEICFAHTEQPCCGEFCKYCTTNHAATNPDPYGAPANPEQKVVFVPFPYPLIVPNANNEEAAEETNISPAQMKQTTSTVTRSTEYTTTTKKPTTKMTTTKSPKPKSKLRAKSVEVSMLSKHRQLKQLNPAVKRNRPAWVPKYGIVPIPDHLAAKLMTQLTEVRALKAKKT